MSDTPYAFDSPDADVILRTPLRLGDSESTEFQDFRAHKAILSIASTVFRDMFSVPQPPQPMKSDNDPPIVHISEPAEVFETFLRLIYPIKPPTITSMGIVDHLSLLAIKYMVVSVCARLEQILLSSTFLKSDPIWVYSIACRMNSDQVAKLAIPYTYQINLVQDIPLPLLQMMTVEPYNRLLKSHAIRRGELSSVISRTKFPQYPYEGNCTCGAWLYTRFLTNINLVIWETPYLDKQRLDLCLSSLDGMPMKACKPGSLCRVSAQVTSAFIDSLLGAIEKLGQEPNH